jgi:uncharacterized phage-associated protein
MRAAAGAGTTLWASNAAVEIAHGAFSPTGLLQEGRGYTVRDSYACPRASERGSVVYVPPLAASLVAKWFIARAQLSEGHDLDNLKLQKLLFLSQSRYLNSTGTPLIKENFEAWKHGPVVATVYRECAPYEGQPIAMELSASGPWHGLPVDVETVLDEIWSAFGVYSGWKLREITHDFGPWERHYVEDKRHIPIPVDEIGSAWPDFARLEADGTAELRTLSDPLARYRSVLRGNPLGVRSGDPRELLDELERTAELRIEATSIHS